MCVSSKDLTNVKQLFLKAFTFTDMRIAGMNKFSNGSNVFHTDTVLRFNALYGLFDVGMHL